MWVSEKHPRYAELTARRQADDATAPPEPSGQILAAFPRKGPEGEQQELRVVLDEYQGHSFIAVRLWQRDRRSGAWWPLRGKGVSVRLSEAAGVADALRDALDQVGDDRPARPAARPARLQQARPARRPEPAAMGPAEEFGELGDF